MPLFGKKKEKGKEEKQRGPAYPTQAASPYPVQAASAYPAQQQVPPPMAYAGNAGPPGLYYPPPSYSSVSTAAPPQASPMGYENHPAGYGAPPPMYSPYAAAPHAAYQYQPVPAAANGNSTVFVPNGFDAGARFGNGSMPNVPPPPPGYAPNAAQMASMQGQTVVMGQRKSDWLEGGSSGGVTFF
ncbi:DAZ-associated protein 2 [Lampetra fluviatilis]